jgi:hypothetical protein
MSGRINKRSIRLVDRAGLFFQEPTCHECGGETVSAGMDRYALTAESAAFVERYRARRWPAAHPAPSESEAGL